MNPCSLIGTTLWPQRCSAKLTSPLDDAGKTDTCPQCGTQFTVPGEYARDRILDERDAAEQAERVKAAAEIFAVRAVEHLKAAVELCTTTVFAALPVQRLRISG